jgi:phosphotransferase system IIB component
MRTSNKILLGTFIAILFIITAIHAALYTKYKRNDFVTMTVLHNERYNSYDIKDVQSVLLTGLQNVTIIPADTARLEIEKNDNNDNNDNNMMRYQFQHGVLTVKGDTTIIRNDNMPDHIRAYQDVILYLPPIQNIKADFCELVINGKKDKANTSSLAIELHETNLHLGSWNRDNDTAATWFDKVNVVKSQNSSIDISGNIIMKELSLNLEASNFEDGKLTCDSLFINTDNTSSVKLSGKNIARTKFALKP